MDTSWVGYAWLKERFNLPVIQRLTTLSLIAAYRSARNSNRRLSLEELIARFPEGGLPPIEELVGIGSPIRLAGREL